MPLRVGIIANPASGRDVRRLTANAGLYSSTDKAAVVQRLLGAFGATGVDEVLMPPDMTGIAAAVLKASASRHAHDSRWPRLEFLDLPLRQSVEDTRHAARLMVQRGVALVAVLGGDGTHKAVAGEVGDIPLLCLSTGTNNAFPELREATGAGLAGGLYASGRIPAEVALRRNKRLRVRLDPGAEHTLLAPLAPGLLQACGIVASGSLEPGIPRLPRLAAGTLALDGEREIEFAAADRPSITLELDGPLSIDVEAALAFAACHRLLAVPGKPVNHPGEQEDVHAFD